MVSRHKVWDEELPEREEAPARYVPQTPLKP
jgi:hypothetical protein